MDNKYQSWGRYPPVQSTAKRIYWRTEPINLEGATSVLPFGLGRSYGDVCLNDQGILLDTAGLNNFIEFDPFAGALRCEAGVTLEEILKLIVPQGWFLPVTPGTKFVTIGGAIANDVHGKNHHRDGTFGCHVSRFELLRSNGERLICAPAENREWFEATIGGLGLTGLILWAEIKLKKVNNPFIDVETIKFNNVEEFFELSIISERDYEYTVAWVDCLSAGNTLGRGLFMRGNHAVPQLNEIPVIPKTRSKTIPVNLPGFILNRLSIKAFNFLYYHRKHNRHTMEIVYYDPFFYPLDTINYWNRLYGKAGFMQYQCVLPCNDYMAIKLVLSEISQSGMGSFLSILKTFGDVKSPGILSFPRKGVTLALDFSNKGRRTLELLERLDKIVRGYSGAVYPAKDARMSAESFRTYYPQMTEFVKFIDPKFSSNFWQRVTEAGGIWKESL